MNGLIQIVPLIEDRRRAGPGGQIRHFDFNLETVGFESIGGRAGGLSGSVDNENAAALAAQPLSGGPPNALRSSGNYCDLVYEPLKHISTTSTCRARRDRRCATSPDYHYSI
jgi:hypothetical protein